MSLPYRDRRQQGVCSVSHPPLSLPCSIFPSARLKDVSLCVNLLTKAIQILLIGLIGVGQSKLQYQAWRGLSQGKVAWNSGRTHRQHTKRERCLCRKGDVILRSCGVATAGLSQQPVGSEVVECKCTVCQLSLLKCNLRLIAILDFFFSAPEG